MPTVKKTDQELALQSHRYKLLDGRLAVSVTAISGLLDDGKSGGMAGAAAKLTREGINYREDWNATRDLGSRVHGHLECWMRGEEIEVPDEEMPYVDALEAWILKDDPQLIEQEAIVLSHLGYGGRFDLLCTIDGETALVDLKAGKKYPVEHALQLSAYVHADGIATYGEDGTLTGTRPLPPIDWAGCLYVRDDGTYSLDRYPVGEDTFDVFCGLLHAHRWTRTDEMKALVKESIPYNRAVKEARELKRGTP